MFIDCRDNNFAECKTSKYGKSEFHCGIPRFFDCHSFLIFIYCRYWSSEFPVEPLVNIFVTKFFGYCSSEDVSDCHSSLLLSMILPSDLWMAAVPKKTKNM